MLGGSRAYRAAINAAAVRNNLDLDDLVRKVTEGGDPNAVHVLDEHLPPGLLTAAGAHEQVLLDFIKREGRIRSQIRAKREQFPGFGNPTSQIESDDTGSYQHLQNGSVFWSESFGAHEVHGAIRDKYAQMGWGSSYLKYPETDEQTVGAGTPYETRYNNFMDGRIEWTPAGGAVVALSLVAHIENHQLGGWIHLSGHGYSPGHTVTFSIEGLANVPGAKAIGSTSADVEGRFKDYVWDARFWSAGGNDVRVRALDQFTGRSTTASIPPLW